MGVLQKCRYRAADVGLDPFPYNGTTTTCEAMWMGVPVVTLAGRTHAGRVGASLLTAVGATDTITGDADAYVATAARLAGDLDGLAARRIDLRGRMAHSPLCDQAAFSRAVTAEFRAMWRRWCDRRP